ncbi:Sec-independent protein translocase protein TatB, partial [Neisseria sp. P0001.S004]
GIKDLGNDAQKNLSDISDGLKPWERLPEQKTPADFGVDELGNPLPDLASSSTENESAAQASEQGGAVQTQELVEAENAESEQDRAWREYLTASVSPAPVVEVSYIESPAADVPPLHTTSLRKQAMSRKRDMRPKFHAKPKLRVRK